MLARLVKQQRIWRWMRWVYVFLGSAMAVTAVFLSRELLRSLSEVVSGSEVTGFQIIFSSMTSFGVFKCYLLGLAGLCMAAYAVGCWHGRPTTLLLLALFREDQTGD